jgi:hypothetical protein
MVYETPLFHDLCDELGILVWQDLMFANFDYPFSDPDFRTLVEGELDALIGLAGGRPSSFCICGGSEIEQQAAMFGLDPGLARDPFFTTRVPAALAAANVDALYLPSAPCGADRPMLASQGVSNWFGVGAYRRPLSETRAAGVRFASECLALANIGDEAPHPNDPEWKRGVPRDMGADWDFDDVRDHYLETLYDVDSGELRRSDPERWLELSRRVSGDVMAEVIGEWRRPGSGCGGAFILWLRDLLPGAVERGEVRQRRGREEMARDMQACPGLNGGGRAGLRLLEPGERPHFPDQRAAVSRHPPHHQILDHRAAGKCMKRKQAAGAERDHRDPGGAGQPQPRDRGRDRRRPGTDQLVIERRPRRIAGARKVDPQARESRVCKRLAPLATRPIGRLVVPAERRDEQHCGSFRRARRRMIDGGDRVVPGPEKEGNHWVARLPSGKRRAAAVTAPSMPRSSAVTKSWEGGPKR